MPRAPVRGRDEGATQGPTATRHVVRPDTERAPNKLRHWDGRSPRPPSPTPVPVPPVWKVPACVACDGEGPPGVGQTCSGCFFGVRVHQATHGCFVRVPEGHPPSWRLEWPWAQRPAGATGEPHGRRTAGRLTGEAETRSRGQPEAVRPGPPTSSWSPARLLRGEENSLGGWRGAGRRGGGTGRIRESHPGRDLAPGRRENRGHVALAEGWPPSRPGRL